MPGGLDLLLGSATDALGICTGQSGQPGPEADPRSLSDDDELCRPAERGRTARGERGRLRPGAVVAGPRDSAGEPVHGHRPRDPDRRCGRMREKKQHLLPG